MNCYKSSASIRLCDDLCKAYKKGGCEELENETKRADALLLAAKALTKLVDKGSFNIYA